MDSSDSKLIPFEWNWVSFNSWCWEESHRSEHWWAVWSLISQKLIISSSGQLRQFDVSLGFWMKLLMLCVHLIYPFDISVVFSLSPGTLIAFTPLIYSLLPSWSSPSSQIALKLISLNEYNALLMSTLLLSIVSSDFFIVLPYSSHSTSRTLRMCNFLTLSLVYDRVCAMIKL